MTIKMLITISFTLLLLIFNTQSVSGSIYCQSSFAFEPSTICDDNQYCCGTHKTSCCTSSVSEPAMEQAFALLIILIIFICCPVMCYRCCCRRTTSQGIVYSPAAGTNTAVTVNLPPQQAQQVPYPTVVPYPQQTPYPPQQYPHNPYYGMPPPAYGVAVQGGTQQASAPSAPYPLS